MNKYKFGNKICELRENKGLTQKELANVLNVSDKAVSKWENGQAIPRIDTLENIADFFDVPVEKLIADDEEKFDIDKERLRLKNNAYHIKSKKVKKCFFIISIFAVGIPALFSLICRLIFLITKNNNFNYISIDLFFDISYPLIFCTAAVFIKTIFFGLMKKIRNYFNTADDCVTCSNLAGYAKTVMHNVSSIFAIPPIVIASSVLNNDDEYFIILIFYILNIFALGINCFTEKYSDNTIVLTGN